MRQVAHAESGLTGLRLAVLSFAASLLTLTATVMVGSPQLLGRSPESPPGRSTTAAEQPHSGGEKRFTRRPHKPEIAGSTPVAATNPIDTPYEPVAPTEPPAPIVVAAGDGPVHGLPPDVPADHVHGDRSAAIARLLRDRPLEPYAGQMVSAADRHGIDWRLLPVMSILESSGGTHACGGTGNAWGYASCDVTWPTFSDGIEAVAAALAAPPYRGLDVGGKLCMWVAGTACVGAHPSGYRDRAYHLMEQLGD